MSVLPVTPTVSSVTPTLEIVSPVNLVSNLKIKLVNPVLLQPSVMTVKTVLPVLLLVLPVTHLLEPVKLVPLEKNSKEICVSHVV